MMPDLRDQLATFQQFAHQKVDAGEAETLEELRAKYNLSRE
jgi:hypothetical protein